MDYHFTKVHINDQESNNQFQITFVNRFESKNKIGPKSGLYFIFNMKINLSNYDSNCIFFLRPIKYEFQVVGYWFPLGFVLWEHRRYMYRTHSFPIFSLFLLNIDNINELKWKNGWSLEILLFVLAKVDTFGLLQWKWLNSSLMTFQLKFIIEMIDKKKRGGSY